MAENIAVYRSIFNTQSETKIRELHPLSETTNILVHLYGSHLPPHTQGDTQSKSIQPYTHLVNPRYSFVICFNITGSYKTHKVIKHLPINYTEHDNINYLNTKVCTSTSVHLVVIV